MPRLRASLLPVALAACSSMAPPEVSPHPAPPDEAPVDPPAPQPPPWPPTPAPPPPGQNPPVTAIAVGDHRSCALLDGGELRCWGATRLAGLPFTPRPLPIAADAASVAVGDRHACVARADGAVACWGDNDDGQLGDGTTADADVLTPVAGLTNIVEVVVGGHHSCARDRDGAVFCWGNEYCTGRPHTRSPRRPGRVAMPAAKQLVAGDDITCALVTGGPTRCWGFNTTLLLDPHLQPVERAIVAKPLERATTLAIGDRHVCAAFDHGYVSCAGDNHYGQLGDQDLPDDAQCDRFSPEGVSCWWRPPPDPPPDPRLEPPPERDPPPSRPAPKDEARKYPKKSWFVPARGVLATALGAAHGRSCAITPERTVVCWGTSHGASDWAHYRPTRIAGIEGAVAIAVAREHACALLADRSVRCWGYNTAGELGNGEIAEHLVAAPAAPVRW